MDLHNPPVRMIATDLDGTLLRSDGTMSARVRTSVKNAQASGIEVVPATGRPRMVAEEVIAQLNFLPHWIFANGSVTWHLGRSELIRGYWLEVELARSLISRIRAAIPGAGFAVEFERTVAYESGFELVVPQLPTVPPSIDLLECITERVQKILVFEDGTDIDQTYTRVSRVVGEEAVASYSGLNFIELAASLVTKATAIEQLAADLGIAREEVASFGDNHNDISMLEWTGRSYAMANATDDAKEAADELIGFNDDDAVADKIDELVAESSA